MYDAFKVGARVKLRRDVERYPHFVAPAGMTGTVTDNGEVLCVRMDDELGGAEAWDNEVQWFDGLDADADLIRLQQALEPVSIGPAGPGQVGSAGGKWDRLLVVTYDITGLTEEEIDCLSGEAEAQAERTKDDRGFFGEEGGTVGHPDVGVTVEIVNNPVPRPEEEDRQMDTKTQTHCTNCQQPESWHSAIDGACSDSEEPHVDSEDPTGLPNMTADQLRTVAKILTPDTNYGQVDEITGFEARFVYLADRYPVGTIELLVGSQQADEDFTRTGITIIGPDGTMIDWYESN